jgi:hypothetical protein
MRWLALALALAGCARTQDAAAPVYSLPAGMAGVYVLNLSERSMFESNKTVSDQGRQIASVGPGRYVFVPIAPGRHDFRCDDLPLTNDVTINAVAGRLYYLRVEMGATAKTQNCDLLVKTSAQQTLGTMKPEAQD